MTFRPNTTLFVNEYDFKPKAKKSVGKLILNLIEGGFRTITGKVAQQNPNNYTINTPVATIGVRGTDYQAYYKDGRLGLGWYKGTPCVRTTKNPKELCLNKEVKYGEVPEPDSAPVPLMQRPDYLEGDLPIDVVNIDGFGSGASETRTINRSRGSGNFCITY